MCGVQHVLGTHPVIVDKTREISMSAALRFPVHALSKQIGTGSSYKCLFETFIEKIVLFLLTQTVVKRQCQFHNTGN